MEELGFDVHLIDGAFLVQSEPILYEDKPREWFTERFIKSPFLEFEMSKHVDRGDIQAIEDGDFILHDKRFDFALNCTYNQAIPIQPKDHMAFYDLCISVVVAETTDHEEIPALSFGIFDGPFSSRDNPTLGIEQTT